MSAATPPPDVPNELRDALVAAGMGVGSFLVRALCDDKRDSLPSLAVKTVLAGLMGVLIGMASKGWFTEAQGTFHLSVAGMAGFCSPELISKGLKFVRTWGNK